MERSSASFVAGSGSTPATVPAATDTLGGVQGPSDAPPLACRPMEPIDEAWFSGLVADALDQVPDALAGLIDNVVVVVEDRHESEDFLGLYDGVPLTERDEYGGLVMPDRVVVYRLAICEMCATVDEVAHQVLVTVVHELAHHFGIEDEALTELGWG